MCLCWKKLGTEKAPWLELVTENSGNNLILTDVVLCGKFNLNDLGKVLQKSKIW